MAREARKAVSVIQECVDKMGCIIANITLNLCHGGLQKVREAAHLEVALMEEEIAYHGSVGDVSPSISIQDPSTS